MRCKRYFDIENVLSDICDGFSGILCEIGKRCLMILFHFLSNSSIIHNFFKYIILFLNSDALFGHW